MSALPLMSIRTIGSRRSTGTPSATEHALAYTSRNTVPSSWSGLADDGGMCVAIVTAPIPFPGAAARALAAHANASCDPARSFTPRRSSSASASARLAPSSRGITNTHDSLAPASSSGMAVGMAGRGVFSAALLLPASLPQIRLSFSSSGVPGLGGSARGSGPPLWLDSSRVAGAGADGCGIVAVAIRLPDAFPRGGP